MTGVTVSAFIAAPVERVFGVFTDFEGSAGRVSNIGRIEMLTLGGARLGARWLETRNVPGGAGTAEMEVTAFEQNRNYTITHHKGGARIEARFSFKPVAGGGTHVEVEFVLAGDGRPPGAVAPVWWAIGDAVRDVLAHDLEDLKVCIEGLPLWTNRRQSGHTIAGGGK
jgi:uncharacterized protein YndB with AHSA1/START domain